ncbi:non-specific lipid-transfer protein 1-like [Senna tora]|uniref:Non-specific lipid-transfer protein n=1 Tax=Senna tora TaxID=362788 RepID=A0A834WQC2_9FABA|nr:non-specific lipid-transfer protein 1-like [Senna tora]
MGSLIMMKLACVMVVCMAVVGAPMARAAVQCGQVTSSLAPCMTYLQNGGAPDSACCGGVKSLSAAAQTTPDRQSVCNCLKGAAAQIPNLDPKNAESLPGLCNVNIPYKISTSTNCATIK